MNKLERKALRVKILLCIGTVLSLIGFVSNALKPTDDWKVTDIRNVQQSPIMSPLLNDENPNRNLFGIDHCQDKACAQGEDGLLGCETDEDFEYVCCKVEEEVDFVDLSECQDHRQKTCKAKNLCSAELLPGFSKGAECLSKLELHGGLVFYILLLLYLFLAIAIVCDDYFSFALDMCADYLGLSSDVKGATFAAIGSSAPELFVSLADNVIANPPKSVGIGTIVGSAIFNILVIIGASSIVAGRTFGALELDWRPLMRDSFFYILSILALIAVVLTNEEALHYEGFFLVSIYFVYLTFMVFNNRIFKFIDGKLGIQDQPPPREEEHDDQTEPSLKRQNSLGTALSKGNLEEVFDEPYFAVFHWPWFYQDQQQEVEITKFKYYISGIFGGGIELWLKRLYFIIVLPINILFRFTIPDARYDLFREDKDNRTDQRKYLYSLEFIMCIIWIAILSHLLVFSASKFGCIVGIDPAIMGLTILAAGTSIPDMITSIILTKNGEGDAAVANSIGSNVFDILIGLGLPWFIAQFVHKKPSSVAVTDLTLGIAFLFGVLIILILALLGTKFKLNSKIGISLLVLYVLYVIFELFVKEHVMSITFS